MLMLLVFGALLHEVSLRGQDGAAAEASTTSLGKRWTKSFVRRRVTTQLCLITRSLTTTLSTQ
uniref:EGF domain specific O-linked N-acetylglucosamine transferase n=1 Tax=Ictidomys tridecemlineatus TaxID=43179 RepID=A0A287D0F7_ICTTR